jgi:predicted nucleic acid-binding protein
VDARGGLRESRARPVVAAFLDTNVLVYAYDRDEPDKRERARAILAGDADELCLSTQVLAEFYWVATRRLARPLTGAQAAEVVDVLAELRVTATVTAIVTSAIELSRTRQLSLWDAMIVRAAQVGACTRLISEGFQPGARFDDVRVENPFAS